MSIQNSQLSERSKLGRQFLRSKIANDERYLGWLFLAPTVLILLFVVIFPLVYSLRLSFTDFTFGMPAVNFVGVENYKNLLKDNYFWNGLKLTIVFVLGTTIISFVVGFAVALLINKPFKWKGIIRTFTLLPMAVTPVVVGIIWLLLFMPDFSMINYLLSLIGIKGPEWLLAPGWALVAVIVAYSWQWTPFFTLMLSAGLASLPIEPYEAASVDGATKFQLLRYMTIPLLRPIILLTLIIRIMDAFRVFDQVFVMTAGGPGRSTQVLSFVIYLNGLTYRYLGYASAMSYVMIIILIVLAIVMVRLLRKVG